MYDVTNDLDDVKNDLDDVKVTNCTCATRALIRHLKARRDLGRVNFRKDFWDCNWGQGKKMAFI